MYNTTNLASRKLPNHACSHRRDLPPELRCGMVLMELPLSLTVVMEHLVAAVGGALSWGVLPTILQPEEHESHAQTTASVAVGEKTA